MCGYGTVWGVSTISPARIRISSLCWYNYPLRIRNHREERKYRPTEFSKNIQAKEKNWADGSLFFSLSHFYETVTVLSANEVYSLSVLQDTLK